MAQTARAGSFLDRPWPLDDVISIPSDSESDTDSDVEVVEQDVPRVHLVHNQHRDDSLPSISAIVASMLNVGHGPTEDVSKQLQTQLQGTAMTNSSLGSSTQDLCLAGERESSDSSALNSPRGVIFVSTVLDDPGIATDSDELVSPAIQQHNDGVNSVLPTSVRRPGVVSLASERRSVQSAHVLAPRDEALQEENAEPPCQPCLASTTAPVQPSQSQNCIVVSSNQCSQIHSVNTDHGHIEDMVSRSDDELHSVARPASAQAPPSECSRAVSCRGGLMVGVQEHQAADNILPMDSRLSSSPTGQGWDEECQTNISANYTVSQPEEPCEEMEKQSSRRRGFRKAYNLRRLPVKRQLTAEQKDGGSNEKLVPQRKRRKFTCPQPKKRGSQQGSGPRRNRKARFLRKNTTKSSSNASVANTQRPAHAGVAGYEAWPLGNPVLKCIKENGTVMFQLQFTSDTLWDTLAAQNDPVPNGDQAPNEVEDQRLRAQSNQHTENIAQQSLQAAYPSIYPDIYRMDRLLARWRRHTFLVKWSDATTTWESRKHIIDKRLLDRFEASWQGFDAGVDVLGARLRAGKLQRLLHWHGRPSKEDTWVRSELLSPQLIRRIQSNEVNGAHI
ncbi:protein-tyrosine phosphatase [Metarhizium robertsii ARSEF 23]|uniref:Protein-tyrosine phosphatase n=1 Tax=Metarhizium robertsii (strain ARSEF 23 / ATCC MYA-3075) TaxID=655844 RepID=A0A0B2XI03_METRA|nr:protein-tyrosine phosphatase [Metarhizium robertsii ARSEF 23]KHO11516.1 protein-tyrosine phosphatase [Metarhizium robertsii ARSEF 23]